MSSGASRAYGVKVASHGAMILVAPHVQYVQPGTPMKAGFLGWEPCAVGEVPDAYAGTSGGGSARITVYRTVTLSNGEWRPGTKYSISDIQWSGRPVFTADAEGPYTAWSPTEITLDVADAGTAARLRAGRDAPSPAPPVEPDLDESADDLEPERVAVLTAAGGEDDRRTVRQRR